VRKIIFYKSPNGRKPVKAFLDSLTDKHSKKVAWVLRLVRDLNFVPKEYLKKLGNSNDIWEIRIRSGNNIFRILCFFNKGNIIILTNGFAKKTQKTPAEEIALAEKRKQEYLRRKKMDDLEKYIKQRKAKSKTFAKDFEEGYDNFRIGFLLKQARKKAGMTQEELAVKLSTKKSAISRIENHADDIRLSTLKNYLEALNRKLQINII
jgi:phage-related protein/DNA-binding XRE family transcriptional regulator